MLGMREWNGWEWASVRDSLHKQLCWRLSSIWSSNQLNQHKVQFEHGSSQPYSKIHRSPKRWRSHHLGTLGGSCSSVSCHHHSAPMHFANISSRPTRTNIGVEELNHPTAGPKRHDGPGASIGVFFGVQNVTVIFIFRAASIYVT